MTWRNNWGRDEKCPITYTRLRPGKDKNGVSYVITLKCKHKFYRKALYKWWLDGNKTCPVCRCQINF